MVTFFLYNFFFAQKYVLEFIHLIQFPKERWYYHLHKCQILFQIERLGDFFSSRPIREAARAVDQWNWSCQPQTQWELKLPGQDLAQLTDQARTNLAFQIWIESENSWQLCLAFLVGFWPLYKNHTQISEIKWIGLCSHGVKCLTLASVTIICSIDDLTWVATHHLIDMNLFTFYFSNQVLLDTLLKLYFIHISWKRIQVNKMMSCNSRQVINAADKCHRGVVTYVFCELLQLMIVAVSCKGVGCWRKIGHLPNCNFLCQ